MIIDDVMKKNITLHGLGFIQIQLSAGQRLHVWHPELPRRSCFEHSSIHNHRFDFRSLILIGEQNDTPYMLQPSQAGSHVLYLHEGARQAGGGRPWTPDGLVDMKACNETPWPPGTTYFCKAFNFHSTRPGGDGRVATILTKGREFTHRGAHSTCRVGFAPDTDLDRFQLSDSQLWDIVADVLGSAKQ